MPRAVKTILTLALMASLVAVAFVACEPSLLANAGLATTDIAVTACLVALVYHFQVNRERGWWRRWQSQVAILRASAFRPLSSQPNGWSS